jgi:hypothetical protein
MLKREIRYEDFDGNMVSDIFYFNLSKPELIELEVEYDKGFGQMLQDIVESEDNKEIIARFKQIVLMAYGEKSEDGKRFVKSDKIREEFSQTAAYSELFMELATDDKAAIVFLNGVLPREFRGAMEKVAGTVTSPLLNTESSSSVPSVPKVPTPPLPPPNN